MAKEQSTGTGFKISEVNLEDFVEPSTPVVINKIPFEVYFQMLKTKNSNIQEHHRAPIRAFVQSYIPSLLSTEKEFDEIVKNY